MAYLIVLRTEVVPVCSNCPYLQYRAGYRSLALPHSNHAQDRPEADN